ncbi:MAG: hypothetical protein DYH13_01940 [Alphaproteobacteria bacterium PRO2]|nr:hypothetical protein [Alphaproteobacteria bacterium PRO2]
MKKAETQTVPQTVDMKEASEKVRAFVLKGYPGLKPQGEGVYGHQYKPGSPIKGPISPELLPMQIGYFTGEKVVVVSDATGHELVVKPFFAAAAAADSISPRQSTVSLVVSPAVLPPPVVEHHSQPVATA